jgi:hypothetical protein
MWGKLDFNKVRLVRCNQKIWCDDCPSCEHGTIHQYKMDCLPSLGCSDSRCEEFAEGALVEDSCHTCVYYQQGCLISGDLVTWCKAYAELDPHKRLANINKKGGNS